MYHILLILWIFSSTFESELCDKKSYSPSASVVDAIAKIPSGVTDGQLMWTASYFYCTNLEGSYNYTWEDSAGVEQWEIRHVIGNHARLPFQIPQFENSTRLRLYVGICVPETCTKEHIHRYIYNGKNS